MCEISARILKRVLTLITVFFLQFSFGQENYVSGYVINKNGDTLQGTIDYRNWEYPPEKINFKNQGNNSPITFTPDDIVEFSVQGDKFFRGIVETEISSSKTNKLKKESSLEIKMDTTFLQVLFDGKKSLYFSRNDFNKDNFYIKQGNVLELLIYKKYLKEEKGRAIIAENKRYLGQLNNYLDEDCKNVKSILANVSYYQNSLVKLFKSYYDCSNSEPNFTATEAKISIEMGLLAGVSISSMNFTGDDDAFLFLTQGDYGSSTAVTAGLFIDVIFPRNMEKWSLNNELMFTKYDFKTSSEDIEHQNQFSLFTTEIGFSYLKINSLVRYKLSNGPLGSYLNGGVSGGFIISENKNYNREERHFYDTETIIEGKALDEFRKFEFGFLLGIGVTLDKLSLEARYERSEGVSKYVTVGSEINRYSILLGYRF